MGRNHRSHGNHSSHRSHSNHANHGNHSSTAPAHTNHSNHANSTTNSGLKAAITPPAGDVPLTWGASLPSPADASSVETRLKEIRDNIAAIRSGKSTEATLTNGYAAVRNPAISDLSDDTFDTGDAIDAGQPNTIAENLNVLSKWMRSTTQGSSTATATTDPSNDGTQPASTVTSQSSPLSKTGIENIQTEVAALAAANLTGKHVSHWNTNSVVPAGHASHSNHSNHSSHANGLHNSHSSHASSSDEKLKDGITNTAYGLDDLMKLRAVDFTWKDTQEKSFGFIAQEVQKVFPEIVTEDADGYLQIDYSLLTAILVRALQEMQD